MVQKRLLVILGMVMCLAMFAQNALAQTVCQLGDANTDVRVLQTRLYTLGYLADEPVSPYKFDAKTKTAVKKFQAASGISASEASATGVVDDVTYERVKRSDAVTYEGYKDQLHVKGGSGTEVLETRNRLKKLGYLSGTQSTQYDQATVNAVATFQRANNLNDTGNADANTRAVLFSDRAITLSAYQAASNLAVVKKGDSGEQVRIVQQQLSALGYYEGSVTGSFTAATVTSVKTFQTANSITVSGIADVTTRELLNSGKGKDFAAYTADQKSIAISQGAIGYAVELLQTRLKELSYYAGGVNGKYNAATVTAVKLFQKGNSLSQTGNATAQVRALMNSEQALNRVAGIGLKQGDNLSAVKDMTTRLKELGYTKSVTTKYTAAVTKVVKVFQKANSLTVTGAADPKTLATLNSSDAVSMSEYESGSGSKKIEAMIKEAYKHLGKPYRTGSACKVPSSFDCSRFTKYVFGKVGVSLSGEVTTQGNAAGSKYGKITAMGNLKRGDLLYFDTQPGVKPIGHAAIYLGKNAKGTPQFIHASSAKEKVVVSEFSDWYKERFLFGVRVFK